MASGPTQAAYAASKHAPCAFSDALVAECQGCVEAECYRGISDASNVGIIELWQA